MPFSIKLKEPLDCDYIFIDENNYVHLLLPIVGGETIGLDNTCKMAMELKNFLFGSDRKPSAYHQLQQYEQALEHDLEALPDSSLLHVEKEKRLQQIRLYLYFLKITDKEGNYSELEGRYIKYPQAVNRILQRQNNCLAMRLSPQEPDEWTAISNPVFKLKRKARQWDFTYDYRDQYGSYTCLSRRLEEDIAYHKAHLPPKKTLKDAIIAEVTRIVGPGPGVDLQQLKEATKRVLNEQYNVNNLDLDHAAIGGTLIDKDYFETILCTIDDWEKETTQTLCEQLLSATTSYAFWEQLDDRVFEQASPEQLPIAVQFFLGQVNLYCHAHGLSSENFGSIMDSTSNLRYLVSDAVIQAKKDSRSIEKTLFEVINAYHETFGLTAPLTKEVMNEITKTFRYHYKIIKESPHFDEFIQFFPGVQGDFVNHKSRISMHFYDFFSTHFEAKIADYARRNTAETLEFDQHIREFKKLREQFTHHTGQQLSPNNKASTEIHFTKLLQEPATTLGVLLLLTTAGPNSRKVYQTLSEQEWILLRCHPQWEAFQKQLQQDESLAELKEAVEERRPDEFNLAQVENLIHSPELKTFVDSEYGANLFARLLLKRVGDTPVYSLLSTSANHQLSQTTNWPLISETLALQHYLPTLSTVSTTDIKGAIDATLHRYETNKSWWKRWFMTSAARQPQIARLNQLKDMLASTNGNALEKNIQHFITTANTLEAIKNEILDEENKRWFKWFRSPSQLRIEIQATQDQLKRQYNDDESSVLHTGDPLAKINEKRLAIANANIPSLHKLTLDWWETGKVQTITSLSNHFHSDQAVLYFNQLGSLAFDEDIVNGLKYFNQSFDFSHPPSVMDLKKAGRIQKCKETGSIHLNLLRKLEQFSSSIPLHLLDSTQMPYWNALPTAFFTKAGMEKVADIMDDGRTFNSNLLIGLLQWLNADKDRAVTQLPTAEELETLGSRQAETVFHMLNCSQEAEQQKLKQLNPAWWTDIGLNRLKTLQSAKITPEMVAWLNQFNPNDLDANAWKGLELMHAQESINWDEITTEHLHQIRIDYIHRNTQIDNENQGLALQQLDNSYINAETLHLLRQLDTHFFTPQGIEYINSLSVSKITPFLIAGLNHQMAVKSDDFSSYPYTDVLIKAGEALMAPAPKITQGRGLFDTPPMKVSQQLACARVKTAVARLEAIVQALCESDPVCKSNKGVLTSLSDNGKSKSWSFKSSRMARLQELEERFRSLSAEYHLTRQNIQEKMSHIEGAHIHLSQEIKRIEHVQDKLAEALDTITNESLPDLDPEIQDSLFALHESSCNQPRACF